MSEEEQPPIPPQEMTVSEFWDWVKIWRAFIEREGISVWAEPSPTIEPGDSMVISYEMTGAEYRYFIQIVEDFDWEEFDRAREEFGKYDR